VNTTSARSKTPRPASVRASPTTCTTTRPTGSGSSSKTVTRSPASRPSAPCGPPRTRPTTSALQSQTTQGRSPRSFRRSWGRASSQVMEQRRFGGHALRLSPLSGTPLVGRVRDEALPRDRHSRTGVRPTATGPPRATSAGSNRLRVEQRACLHHWRRAARDRCDRRCITVHVWLRTRNRDDQLARRDSQHEHAAGTGRPRRHQVATHPDLDRTGSRGRAARRKVRVVHTATHHLVGGDLEERRPRCRDTRHQQHQQPAPEYDAKSHHLPPLLPGGRFALPTRQSTTTRCDMLYAGKPDWDLRTAITPH